MYLRVQYRHIPKAKAKLTHGVGGTCWSTGNALCGLLTSLGFDARRVAGSMRDRGYIGHGSVKVRIDDTDWLADPSMLTDIPIPLTDEIFISGDLVYGSESEPGGLESGLITEHRGAPA